MEGSKHRPEIALDLLVVPALAALRGKRPALFHAGRFFGRAHRPVHG